MAKQGKSARGKRVDVNSTFSHVALEFVRAERAAGRFIRGYHLDDLRDFFKGCRPDDIDDVAIRAYARHRQKQRNVTNDGINEELRLTLRPLLQFAKAVGKLTEIPGIYYLPRDPQPPHRNLSYIERIMSLPVGSIASSRQPRAAGGRVAQVFRSAPPPAERAGQSQSEEERPVMTKELLAQCRDMHAGPQKRSYAYISKWLLRVHRVRTEHSHLGRLITGKRKLPASP
jgi:hypothetical protein